jgi:hypothetical protein
MRRWEFDVPSINNLVQPIEAGVERYDRLSQQARENERQNALLEMRRRAAELEQEKFGLERGRYDREMKRADMMDPLDVEARRAQIAQTQAGIGAQRQQMEIARQAADHTRAMHPLEIEMRRAQIDQLRQKDVMAEAQARMLGDLFPGSIRPRQDAPASPPAAPAQPQSGFQRQSFQGDPNLIPVQTAQPDAQTQQPEGLTSGMSPQRRAGLGLALIGKGDAGKILAESDPSNIEKKTRGEIEEKLMGLAAVNERLGEIRRLYRPEFQTIDNRMGMAWDDLKSRFAVGRAMMTPEQTKELQDFAEFRAFAADNMNEYIKYVTGAAMTNAEAGRIEKAMPKAGDGIFDGDSPPAFESKMKAAMRSTQMAIARYHYFRNQGFQGNVSDMAVRMPLDRMGGVIQQRTDQLLQQQRQQNPGAPLEQIKPLIQQQLRKEFGMGPI